MNAPINTNRRLFDLVRYMRSELHKQDLIDDDEYAWLCSHVFADDPKTGSPSRRRLEDYDGIRTQLAATRKELEAAREEQKRLEEVARRQYWALREGDNIVRHIRTTLFPGWTNMSDNDVNTCLRDYEKEHGIAANYTINTALTRQHLQSAPHDHGHLNP